MNVTLFGRASKFFPARGARNVAYARSQRLENRIEPLHRLFWSANHHAVTALQTPDPAAGAHVQIVNAFALELPRTPDVVFEIRIAAVDDGIPGLHGLRQLLHSLLGGTARR